MRIDELDDERFTEQLKLRRELASKLVAEGFDLYDMHDNGDTRYCNAAAEIKTLRWNGKNATYEIV